MPTVGITGTESRAEIWHQRQRAVGRVPRPRPARGSGGVQVRRACGRRGGSGSVLRGARGQLSQPRIAMTEGTGGPRRSGPRRSATPLVRAEPVRQQHASVDHRGLRQACEVTPDRTPDRRDRAAHRGPMRVAAGPERRCGGRAPRRSPASETRCGARAMARSRPTSARRRGPRLAGIAAAARNASTRSRTGHRLTGDRRDALVAVRTRSSGLSRSIARRQRPREVGHRIARRLLEPSRQGVVGGEIGHLSAMTSSAREIATMSAE